MRVYALLPSLSVGLCLTALSAHPSRAQTPAVIDGLVADSALRPLDGATVAVFGTNVHVETGSSGRFRIQQVPAGQYLLIVRKVGYRPISGFIALAANDTLRLSYTMERALATLDTVVVTGQYLSLKMAEFELRRRQHVDGAFLGPDDIEKRGSVFTTELLRTFLGVSVVALSSGGGMTQYVALNARIPVGGFGGGGCVMPVFVDGIRQPTPVNLDQLPSPRELAGVEVYLGSASLPQQYALGSGFCGGILLWRRDGP
jgi:hypothetical protein